MPEPVRLLIWDLDETFWHGTVTEGGHTYRADTHAIVQALADRGIPSGICSKNDPARIEPILRAAGIWDDFVFPSIGWGAKGPRLRDLIATIGLRPASVMFVDDSPANRNEALHFVPELQVAAETFIPHILDSPLFAGKPDPGRTRLAHYKLLERRHADAASSGGDNHAFLRASGLEVRIEHDVDAHVDRAIELINRTYWFMRFSRSPEPSSSVPRCHLPRWKRLLLQSIWAMYLSVGVSRRPVLLRRL